MQWIAKNVPRNAIVFETGCGCGANLIWLGQKYFTNLFGSDRSDTAIAAARDLAALAKIKITFWTDDGLQPSNMPARFDVMIAINWLYYSASLDLHDFLLQYRDALSVDGVIVMDMIDSAFNQCPNNEYSTDDWHLPPEQRRPSQYKSRMAREEVARIARSANFEVLATLPGTAIPPRFVMVMKRR
jgi:cyclopropane fatty-acyl-phospholipid synthase-like methyltransferase